MLINFAYINIFFRSVMANIETCGHFIYHKYFYYLLYLVPFLIYFNSSFFIDLYLLKKNLQKVYVLHFSIIIANKKEILLIGYVNLSVCSMVLNTIFFFSQKIMFKMSLNILWRF